MEGLFSTPYTSIETLAAEYLDKPVNSEFLRSLQLLVVWIEKRKGIPEGPLSWMHAKASKKNSAYWPS